MKAKLKFKGNIIEIELKKVSGSTSDWTLSARVRVTTTNINGL